MADQPTLAAPTDQPYTARFSGAASMRSEIEALLAAAPEAPTTQELRALMQDSNVTAKASARGAEWAWMRTKLRYGIDEPLPAEFHAFQSAWREASSPQDRGLICGLQVARTDRTFRELALEFVAPYLLAPGTVIHPESLLERIATLPRYGPRDWSAKSQHNIAAHVLAALKDFGLLTGSSTKRTVTPRPGPTVTRFAAVLGRLEGLTDLGLLDSLWFRFLGADRDGAVSLLRDAARAGVLRFRMQAEVVELDLDTEQRDAAQR